MITDEEQREKDFRIYLENTKSQKGNKFKKKKIDEFIEFLKESIPKEIGNNINLFSITNQIELEKIKKELTQGALNKFNTNKGNGSPSNAIFQYLKFLKKEEDKIESFDDIKIEIYKNSKDDSLISNSEDKKEKFVSDSIDYNFLHKNLLLKGVPGTGKSHTIENIIENDLNLKEKQSNICRINIHSASSNADLMQGIGIDSNDGKIEYKEKQGLIFNHIRKALFAPNQPFVLVLEEIQENSLNELIGDLIYLIDLSSTTLNLI